nr:hypothetical protein [Thermoflexibacter sp.]
YVGSAEPQLREKLAGLYSEIATYYGKPSNAQMINLALLESKIKEAQTSIDNLKSKQLATLNAQLVKLKLEEIKLRTFEEFKAADK